MFPANTIEPRKVVFLLDEKPSLKITFPLRYYCHTRGLIGVDILNNVGLILKPKIIDSSYFLPSGWRELAREGSRLGRKLHQRRQQSRPKARAYVGPQPSET